MDQVANSMVKVMEIVHSQKLTDQISKIAVISAQSEMVSREARKIRSEDSSLSWKEAGEAARQMLGIDV